ARTFVNDYRDRRRGDSLKQRLAANPNTARTAAAPDDPDRGRYLELLRQSLSQALAQLDPKDRLRLSYYHLHELTLAETGRLLGEHESTVSRKLERTRGALRKQIEERLRRTYDLSSDQVRACYEYALETWPYDLKPDLEAEG
ncbi:MAG: sigma-70 family RNA polymerase sigma factor, partial [Candidatus Binatia bacterium]